MNNMTVITSVLGLDLKTELRDAEGNIVRSGIRSTYIPKDMCEARIGTKLATKKWFTHYNQALLDKIRDMRRNID
jgi:hypothetical protein